MQHHGFSKVFVQNSGEIKVFYILTATYMSRLNYNALTKWANWVQLWSEKTDENRQNNYMDSQNYQNNRKEIVAGCMGVRGGCMGVPGHVVAQGPIQSHTPSCSFRGAVGKENAQKCRESCYCHTFIWYKIKLKSIMVVDKRGTIDIVKKNYF